MNCCKMVYNALIQPYVDYCCEVWDTLNKGLSESLQKLHKDLIPRVFFLREMRKFSREIIVRMRDEDK